MAGASPSAIRPRVLVTRPAEESGELRSALARRALEPVVLPLLGFESALPPEALQATLAAAGECWLALTSPRAARLSLPCAPGIRIAVVGPGTRAVAEEAGAVVDLEGSGAGAAGLVEAFARPEIRDGEARTVIWPCGDRARPELGRGLDALGYQVVPIQVYRTVLLTPEVSERDAALRDLAAACFSSPSGVEAFLAICDAAEQAAFRAGLVAAAIGGTTAAALSAAGFRRIVTAARPGAAALADAVASALFASPGPDRRSALPLADEESDMSSSLPRSTELLSAAQKVMPGGVNSPVRAYKSVGGTPPFIASAQGCRVTDVDGNTYIDLICGYGPHILGHRHPRIDAAVRAALECGTAFGAPTEGEVRIAEEICCRVPSVEMVRLVNSGTEATMSALRVARAFTGRDRFIKFNGNYHGHGDAFLVRAGSGALTHGAPDSPGVPAPVVQDTLVAEYNDLASVEALFAAHGGAIAAIFVEPVAGNVGCVLPDPGFLEGLRALCDQHGALLIFDEVMTGFRVAAGGYQEICGIRPDLTTMGKVIGGGLPVGAYGGRRDVMSRVSPAGDVYQAGTLSGNPLAVAAGRAALEVLADPGIYRTLEDAGAHLQSGLENILETLEIPGQINRQGSMLALYFSDKPVRTLTDVMASDTARFRDFFHRMRENGVLLAPSPFEAWFLSCAHDTEALDLVLEAARDALR